MDSTRAVAVSHLGFLRAEEKYRLYRAVPSADALWRLSRDDIGDIIGRRLFTRAWNPVRLAARVERDLAFLAGRGIRLLRLGEPGYPPWLAEIFDPPFLLFVLGKDMPVTRPILAIVGTRRPTNEGRSAARALGAEAARFDVPVVSGLARGIDTESHVGCLDAAGTTVAVLGCGIDLVYPAENRTLARRLLAAGGTIVSEYPPGTPPRQFNFPERNRIISGLARATVVVEAPERSGALITADYALDQGRDLYVHRVAERSPRGAGARALAADGAEVVDGTAKVVATWGCSAAAGFGPAAGKLSDAEASPQSVGLQLALELEEELCGGDDE
ncbi:MAG: DNA-processing protein DprA [Spirochaetaceae bacterium]